MYMMFVSANHSHKIIKGYEVVAVYQCSFCSFLSIQVVCWDGCACVNMASNSSFVTEIKKIMWVTYPPTILDIHTYHLIIRHIFVTKVCAHTYVVDQPAVCLSGSPHLTLGMSSLHWVALEFYVFFVLALSVCKWLAVHDKYIATLEKGQPQIPKQPLLPRLGLNHTGHTYVPLDNMTTKVCAHTYVVDQPTACLSGWIVMGSTW